MKRIIIVLLCLACVGCSEATIEKVRPLNPMTESRVIDIVNDAFETNAIVIKRTDGWSRVDYNREGFDRFYTNNQCLKDYIKESRKRIKQLEDKNDRLMKHFNLEEKVIPATDRKIELGEVADKTIDDLNWKDEFITVTFE